MSDTYEYYRLCEERSDEAIHKTERHGKDRPACGSRRGNKNKISKQKIRNKKMGMASSQARLLNLTARMHQIEYKAAKLEAQKLQLANESSAVYDTYLEALDATKIQYSSLTSDGSITYIDATYASLQAAGYILVFKDQDLFTDEDCPVIIDQATLDNYNTANGNENYFIALESSRGTVNDDGSITVTEVDDEGNTTEWIEIYTASQLKNMSETGNYRLMSDIEITDEDEWESISSFSGTFDGNGYTISGLTSALFNKLSGAAVSNLVIQGNVIADEVGYNDAVGILVNYAYNSSISDVFITENSSLIFNSEDSFSYLYVGALAGLVTDTIISRCESNADVSVYTGDPTADKTKAGGLIGCTENSTIQDCCANGDVDADEGACDVGGLIGASRDGTKILSCLATGNVSGYNDAGGLCGAIAGTIIIDNCFASGNITDALYGGSLIGWLNDMTDETYISGNATGNIDSECTSDTTLIGALNNATITIYECDEDTDPDSPQIETTTSLDDEEIDSSTYTVTGVTNAKELYELIESGNYLLDSDYAELSEGYYVTLSEYSADGYENDTTWLTNMINEGYLYIYTLNSDGELEQTSVATNTGLREVSDETNLKKAEAQYEADMLKIDKKERRYDTDLAAVETERDAISSEIDTLETVASDNVERTFKLFS